MLPFVLVPTYNNPVGLAGLLSSLLAVFAESVTSGHKPVLVLMDGSNDPVIADPHVSRLLTRFTLHYQHFLEPQVNRQRLFGLTLLVHSYDMRPVLILDDDLILLRDPSKAVDDFLSTKATVFFGRTVDILNDRRYPDYAFSSDKADNHSFPAAAPTPDGSTHCKNLANFSASPGHMMILPKDAIRVLSATDAATRSAAIADDTFATMMAERSPIIHESMWALHVGNRSQHWSSGLIKHEAVCLLKEKLHGSR